jgi:hypothetical protein
MDSFIKKIFDGKIDHIVHLQFQKFSRGEFKDRAMVKASKSKDTFSIRTTQEYANGLVRSVAEKMKDDKIVKVTGVIVSTRDLTESDVKFKNKKQFMGVKQYVIDDDFSKEQIINLCNKFPTSFLALSFANDETILKIKPKAPKSAKPSTSEKGPSIDFCKIKTKDTALVKEILFDAGNFKNIEIKHIYLITDLIIPKDEKDPLKMRENTIRKGRLIREINTDGKIIKKEVLFEA